MSDTHSSSLDAEALQRLRDLDPTGKNRLIERVLGAFHSSSTRLAAQLEQARASGDVAGIQHVAHTLKSSSASIGALALARLCAEIEASIRADATAGMPARLQLLDDELKLVLQAVQTTLGDSRGMEK